MIFNVDGPRSRLLVPSRYDHPVAVEASFREEDWVATRWILAAVLKGMFSPGETQDSGATTSRHPPAAQERKSNWNSVHEVREDVPFPILYGSDSSRCG